MHSALLLPSVTPKPTLEVLIDGSGDFDAGTIAIKTVQTQLANHETRRNTRLQSQKNAENRVPSLFDAAVTSLANSVRCNPEDERSMKAVESLPPNVLSRITLKLDIPYDMFCRARQSGEGNDGEDIDEWILRNEVWLRETPPNYEERQVSKRFRWDGATGAPSRQQSNWQRGIVRLSAHADDVFSGSQLTDTCRVIRRSKSLPGFKFLNLKRPSKIRIQPSVRLYAKTFKSMTDGLLTGPNWDHIFVAGGIVLGTLLCTEDEDTTNTPEQWKSSDVDLYIYGLGPVEANKKIEHIFDVFKKNLPKDAPVLVVRNSKTITFYSKYPLRRVQVVLKLVDSPKSVLLNFDLDICAVGWDGEEVWMLPRAARALETGYTVFTMDLINGHYLGDRRATQEERVFKYADKGYGIRILPAYLREFQIIKGDPKKLKMLGINGEQDFDSQGFEDIIASARHWTARAVKKLGKLQRYNLRYKKPPRSSISFIPTILHAMLQERDQDTEDPQRRSVLSGLRLLMRHVALWEHEAIGNISIEKKTWASPTYDAMYHNHFGVGYNDTPDYPWDNNFTIEGFITCLNDFNKTEKNGLARSVGCMPSRYDWSPYISENDYLDKALLEGFRPQRITYAASVQEILTPEHDISLPVWLPKHFIDFANRLIPKAVRESGVLNRITKVLKPALRGHVRIEVYPDEHEELQLVFWKMTNITMWQQLNRAIDEVHEALWSFHHANAGFGTIPIETRTELLYSQFAKRAIRMTTQDEYGAFVRWVTRVPADFKNQDDDVSERLKRPYSDDEKDEYSSDEYTVPIALMASEDDERRGRNNCYNLDVPYDGVIKFMASM